MVVCSGENSGGHIEMIWGGGLQTVPRIVPRTDHQTVPHTVHWGVPWGVPCGSTMGAVRVVPRGSAKGPWGSPRKSFYLRPRETGETASTMRTVPPPSRRGLTAKPQIRMQTCSGTAGLEFEAAAAGTACMTGRRQPTVPKGATPRTQRAWSPHPLCTARLGQAGLGSYPKREPFAPPARGLSSGDARDQAFPLW